MKRISSASTDFYKRVFPRLWFGFLGLFATIALLPSLVGQAQVMFLVVPCALGVFGYFLMKKLVWGLVDEVYDCGDSLLIRDGGLEYQVPLADITNVSSSAFIHPPRITLRLASTSGAWRLGSDVAFFPQGSFMLNPLAGNSGPGDLIVRIAEAQSKRADARP